MTTGETVTVPSGSAATRLGWRKAHAMLAWVLVAGIVAQVLLAGLATFGRPDLWRWHVSFANVVQATALVMLLIALLARLRGLRTPSAILLLLLGLQHGLADLGGLAGGFHAVNALVLTVLALDTARRGLRPPSGIPARR